MTAPTTVAVDQVAEGIHRLGLGGRVLCIHVSLRSFPRLQAGPATLIDGLLAAGATVVIPTMASQAFGIPAPPDDRPARNGMDYAARDAALAAAEPGPGTTVAFHPDRMECDSGLGATPAYVARHPDRVRAAHPTGAFSAMGPLAGEIIGADVPDDTFGPLRAVVAHDGYVVLMGVGLTSMTLLHLAEVEAGRASFIRWARGPHGEPVRSRGGGCSAGFDRLEPHLVPCERRTTVGASLWRAFPAGEVVSRAAAAIRSQPDITSCTDPDCLRCADAVAGGPIEPAR